MRHKPIVTPRSALIEKTALELAATWYEIGRSQGLTSKHKNARAYARANLERFIPNATNVLLEMLKPTSNITEDARREIYEAMMERVNDPHLNEIMPNVDITRAIELSEQMKKPADKIVIDTSKSKLQ